MFALTFIMFELIYLKLGYMQYINWNIGYSAAFYLAGFRFGAYLAPRISTYSPPVPYWARLLAFSHMIIMWVGALFASPILKFYQFKPGLFHDFMADCRFTDLLSGDLLAMLCTIFIPRVSKKRQPLILVFITCIGISFAYYCYHKGWLMYHHWNHFFTALRYVFPMFLIMLYHRWETSFENQIPRGTS
ncbi:MAG: hypothetical protein K0S39_3979 [Paenibacillus sp.]|nr:hypothetical protein [Paenibacillus sp.]